MDQVFRAALDNELVWLPEKGWGYYNVKANPYDKTYYDNYIQRSNTEIGKKLNESRIDLVDRYAQGARVCDVGVGSGMFVLSRNNTKGYDVNPFAVEMLKSHGKFADYYEDVFHSITCWDSFEHIQNTRALLSRVQRYVFMSLPIFDDLAHVLRSKHYKKDEHCYYFTNGGLISYMREHDFTCIETSVVETLIGREDIGSYVFQRML